MVRCIQKSETLVVLTQWPWRHMAGATGLAVAAALATGFIAAHHTPDFSGTYIFGAIAFGIAALFGLFASVETATFDLQGGGGGSTRPGTMHLRGMYLGGLVCPCKQELWVWRNTTVPLADIKRLRIQTEEQNEYSDDYRFRIAADMSSGPTPLPITALYTRGLVGKKEACALLYGFIGLVEKTDIDLDNLELLIDHDD